MRGVLATLALIGGLGLAGAAAAQPSDPEAYAALWSDIDLNVTIGNGNLHLDMVWGWGAAQGQPPKISIDDLACAGDRTQGVCHFTLRRESHPQAADPRDLAQPRALKCQARFRRYKRDGWRVVHLPRSPRGGHSRTTMTCETPG